MLGKEYLSPLKKWVTPEGHRYAAIEMHTLCNRSCSHCAVPGRNAQLGTKGVRRALDLVSTEDIQFVTLLAGEPILYIKTEEGITVFQHTLESIDYAKNKGMLVGISTNGDYFTQKTADDLKQAGLNWITLSYHTETKQALDHLIRCGQMAADRGIVPMIHFLITNQNAVNLPELATYAAKNGLLINATVVQEKGDSFSVRPEISLIPSLEQQVMVYRALDRLRAYGFARINRKLLLENSKWYPNKWKCNPEEDYFVHIGAEGTLNICEEARTGLNIFDIDDLKDPRWREQKRALVEKCTGCLYRCYFESERPNIIGDMPAAIVMALIKIGKANLVRAWGKVAARMLDTERSLAV